MVGLSGALERLTAYKPARISGRLIVFLWMAYLAVTLWLTAARLRSLWDRRVT